MKRTTSLYFRWLFVMLAALTASGSAGVRRLHAFQSPRADQPRPPRITNQLPDSSAVDVASLYVAELARVVASGDTVALGVLLAQATIPVVERTAMGQAGCGSLRSRVARRRDSQQAGNTATSTALIVSNVKPDSVATRRRRRPGDPVVTLRATLTDSRQNRRYDEEMIFEFDTEGKPTIKNLLKAVCQLEGGR